MTGRERTAGFTFVEIMIVLTVIATLATVIASSALSAAHESRATLCEKNRILYEDAEQMFLHKERRYSTVPQELFDEGYVSRVQCPAGGVLTWDVDDPQLPWRHQAMVCSVHGPKTRLRAWRNVPSDPEHALFDDFDDPIAAAWTRTHGRWHESGDGSYYLGRRAGRSGLHRMLAGDSAWSDYTLETTVDLARGRRFGLLMRVTNPKKPNGYLLDVAASKKGGGTLTLRRVVNGRNGKKIATSRIPRDVDLRGEHQLQVALDGNEIVAHLDGREVVRASDGAFGAGGVGIQSQSNSQLRIDEVRVDTR